MKATKKNKKAPSINFLNFNHKKVIVGQDDWWITAQKVGPLMLVDARCEFGPSKGQFINMMDSRSKVANTIRERIQANLVS